MTPPRLREGFKPSLLLFLGVRAGASLLCLAGVTLISPRGGDLPTVAGWPIAPLTAGWHNLFTGFERQDAAWFLGIATHGYARGDGSAAFFPLYPAAIRAVSLLPGIGPLGAALIVSNLAFLGALVMLHGLTRLEGMSATTARRTNLYLAIFPTAFFFLAPYSEAPFLLLAVSAFWFARRDRWALAGLVGALAAMTRSIGVLLVPALAIEAIHQSRNGGALIRRLAGAAAIAAGPLLYLSYWQIKFGEFWAPLHAQQHWSRDLTLPSTAFWHALTYARDYGSYWLIDLLLVGIVMAAVLAGVSSLRPSYLFYAAASLLLPLSEPIPWRPLLSMPRFVIEIFPAFWLLARAAERHRLPEPLVTAVFAGGYGVLALLFVNWWHIF